MTGKVLVVKDEGSACQELREFLEDKGYKVEEVHSGRAALKAYRYDRPDVVLLDVLRSSNGGLKTLRKIKAIDPLAIVIMVTAGGEREAAKQVMAEGAYEYITKPIDYGYLELALLTNYLLVATVGLLKEATAGF